MAKATFTQAEIQRVVKAARGVGLPVEGVNVSRSPDGEIRISTAPVVANAATHSAPLRAGVDI